MLDLFGIMGPIMVGPSSSHTAGAVRIGRMARTLLGDEPASAAFHLHGSFAETGAGHGTDRALVAGLLGMHTGDLRIPESFSVAAGEGLVYSFDTVELRDAHPNSVKMEISGKSGATLDMQACSTGGGRILVTQINGTDVSFAGDYHTLLVRNRDGGGSLSAVISALQLARVNVASMHLHRDRKGGSAIMIIETDDPIPASIVELLLAVPGIERITRYQKEA